MQQNKKPSQTEHQIDMSAWYIYIYIYVCVCVCVCGSKSGRSSKFRESSRVRQTPEEGRRTYRPKRCGNNNKDEDNSPKNLNDRIYSLKNGGKEEKRNMNALFVRINLNLICGAQGSINIWGEKCCELFWTTPGGSTPQSSSCTATYHPLRKLSKLDEPNKQDTAGEVGTNS